ncbi:hypothetical protein HPB49_016593 [Dermacentor silvarum]|uniref:Uncharacterized protein n=1 Tax=Dermacentor silvarum TaxID=543639 RepID=A0ACB8CAC9_DERSI|nr:hypothetical protein HPB49_016593 [Dermacentor silvarum]
MRCSFAETAALWDIAQTCAHNPTFPFAACAERGNQPTDMTVLPNMPFAVESIRRQIGPAPNASNLSDRFEDVQRKVATRGGPRIGLPQRTRTRNSRVSRISRKAGITDIL